MQKCRTLTQTGATHSCLEPPKIPVASQVQRSLPRGHCGPFQYAPSLPSQPLPCTSSASARTMRDGPIKASSCPGSLCLGRYLHGCG